MPFASPHVADNGEAVPRVRPLSRSTSYIPYGEIFVEESSAGWQSPYYFNSKELDEETGLYYYGARYLNPTEARWLSVDPMWEKYAGMSPYNYCAGNPIKYVDPDGKEKIISFCTDKMKSKNSKTWGEFLKTGDQLIKNRRLVGYAIKYDDVASHDVINIWVHGNSNGFVTKQGEIIDNYISFFNFLIENSEVFRKNEEQNNPSVIVLHSCSTGAGKNSFAQRMSEDLGALIIAPSDNIEGELHKETIKNEGTWNVFYKGEFVDSYKGYDAQWYDLWEDDAIQWEQFFQRHTSKDFIKYYENK